MITWLIYLLETVVCSGFLYLLYHFCFKQETYLNFNRAYLLGILLFTPVIPLMHIQLEVNQSAKYSKHLENIGHTKNYYELLIAQASPEFIIHYQEPVNFEDAMAYNGTEKQTIFFSATTDKGSAVKSQAHNKKPNIAKWLLVIYLCGAGFFIVRSIYSYLHLLLVSRKQPKRKIGSNTIIEITGNTSVFSFFNLVFINRKKFSNNELNYIIKHEQAHISELHTIDLIIVQLFTAVFWLNPFMWVIQKALKANHEYLADKKTVQQVSSVFDYRELLLRQYISMRTLVPVHHFNLLFIKNRMNMMTKNKSTRTAQLKTALVIPVLLGLLLLFTDFTLKSGSAITSNRSGFESARILQTMHGVWISTNHDVYAQAIEFKEDMIFCLQNNEVVKNKVGTKGDHLVFYQHNAAIPVKYKHTAQKLSIWWTNNVATEYHKSTLGNSLDLIAPVVENNIELSTLTSAHKYNVITGNKVYDIAMKDDKIWLNNKQVSISALDNELNNLKASFNVLESNKMTCRLYIDNNQPLKQVETLFEKLREHSLLKLAFMGLSEKASTNLEAHISGIPNLLPPKDAKMVDMSQIEKDGITVHSFKVSEVPGNLTSLKQNVKEKIKANYSCVFVIEFKDTDSYASFLKTRDTFTQAYFEIRDEKAMEKYGVVYNDLGKKLQNIIRKQVPMRITLANEREYK